VDEEVRDPGSLLASLADGRAKLHIIRRGLAVRRAHPMLFHGGRYLALHADAGREENVCAFALVRSSAAVIAVAPRLFARLMNDDAAPTGVRIWGDSSLHVPKELHGPLENVLTGEKLTAQERLPLAQVLSRFPVALLVKG
jgi:(1->4)-alpha-D-glucan 1-alpha-D-glucosylmutase